MFCCFSVIPPGLLEGILGKGINIQVVYQVFAKTTLRTNFLSNNSGNGAGSVVTGRTTACPKYTSGQYFMILNNLIRCYVHDFGRQANQQKRR